MKTQSRSWLTSFVDLLTVLLCFIVAAVYQGAKQHQQKTQSYQLDSPSSGSKVGAPEASGKQIASKLVTESPHLALTLVRDDFGATYSALSKKGIHGIQTFAEQTVGALEVGICNVGFGFSEAVFENITNQLAPRMLKWTIGSEVCTNLRELGSKSLDDTILLTAYDKQSHG
jgi:hypothetical protein